MLGNTWSVKPSLCQHPIKKTDNTWNILKEGSSFHRWWKEIKRQTSEINSSRKHLWPPNLEGAKGGGGVNWSPKAEVRGGSWSHAGVTEGTLSYRNEVTRVGDSVRGKAGQDKTLAFLPLPPASFLPPSTSHGLNHSEKPAATGAGITLPGRERGWRGSEERRPRAQTTFLGLIISVSSSSWVNWVICIFKKNHLFHWGFQIMSITSWVI